MTRKLSRHAWPEGRLTEAQYTTVLGRTGPLLVGLSRAPITHMLVEAYVLGMRDAASLAAPTGHCTGGRTGVGQVPGTESSKLRKPK